MRANFFFYPSCLLTSSINWTMSLNDTRETTQAWDSDIFQFYFFAWTWTWTSKIKNKQKSKNTYKLLKINTLNIFSFSLLHVAKNTEQRQSPGSWWLCLVFFAPLDLQFNTQFHKMLDPLPGHPLPIIYSSLFRRVCQRRTVQSARKQLLELTTVSNLSNRASLLSTHLYMMYTAALLPNPRSVGWDRRSGEKKKKIKYTKKNLKSRWVAMVFQGRKEKHPWEGYVQRSRGRNQTVARAPVCQTFSERNEC